jgi:hypothetical protein
MKQYTFYDNVGLIKTNMILVNDQEADLNSNGLSWIEGSYSADSYCIKNDEPVEVPSKPDYPCHFYPEAMQWVWDDEVSWRQLRRDRDRRLAACDWTQVPDAPVNQAAWAVYRQQLRDLPDNTEDPRNPVWPTPPA